MLARFVLPGVLLVLFGLPACLKTTVGGADGGGPDDAKERGGGRVQGSEGGPCMFDDICDGDLTCFSNTCVDTGMDPDPDVLGTIDASVAPRADTGTGTTLEGGCEAGHYVGQLAGTYVGSVAFGMSVPLSTDPASVDAAVLTMLYPPAEGVGPGFEFFVQEAESTGSCNAGQEYCFDYEVVDGKARGVVNGLFPFEMDLIGDLDCGAGIVQGVIENGWYEVSGIKFSFDGTFDGSHDASTAAFFDGQWIVSEPGDPQAGGDGNWVGARVEN